MTATAARPTPATSQSSLNCAVWQMLSRRWEKTLKAKALSPKTIHNYLRTVDRWAAWLDDEELNLDPDQVEAHHIDDFIVDIIEATSPGNGAFHYRNLRVFFEWLVKRKEINGSSPMTTTEAPRVPEFITPLLSDEEHTAILACCGGRSFADRRDTAIILLLIDTGLRIAELVSLKVDDIDLAKRKFGIWGKGNKYRFVGFGNSAGLALARYLRERAKHRCADLPELWLSTRLHRPLSINGVQHMLNRRGKAAGIAGNLYAHRFRHDFSHRWQEAGGSEHGLMMIAGWSSAKMPRHYGKQAAMQRALAEQQTLGIADRIT